MAQLQSNQVGRNDERRSQQHQQGQTGESTALTRGTEGRGRSMQTRRSIEPFLGTGIGGPFSFMRRLMEDVDRLFDEVGMTSALSPFAIDVPRRGARSLSPALWAPPIEVTERDGRIVVRADVPGLNADDVRVTLDGDVLTIEGERRQEREDTREGVYVSERSYGLFRRSIELPPGVDPNSIEARVDNGVLEISIAVPKSTGRNIEVRPGGGTRSLEMGAGGRSEEGSSSAAGGLGSSSGAGSSAGISGAESMAASSRESGGS